MPNYTLTFEVVIDPPAEDPATAQEALCTELAGRGVTSISSADDGVQRAPAQITVDAANEAAAIEEGLRIIEKAYEKVGLRHQVMGSPAVQPH